MNAPMPPTGDLYLVVGYDGSAPATRALDAAARLLSGRTGSIDVLYVAHLTTAEMMSAGAIAEMEIAHMARPIGTFTQNTDRQPTSLTSTPPTTGPHAVASPNSALQIPIACARSRASVNTFRTIDSETGR